MYKVLFLALVVLVISIEADVFDLLEEKGSTFADRHDLSGFLDDTEEWYGDYKPTPKNETEDFPEWADAISDRMNDLLGDMNDDSPVEDPSPVDEE